MSTANVLGRVREKPRRATLTIATWALGLLWWVLAPLHFILLTTTSHHIAPVALFFIAAVCGLAAWLAVASVDSLSSWAKVLGQRQVPTRLWHQRLQCALTDALKLWALLGLAVATVSWAGPAPWQWLTGVALVSVVLVLAAAAALATRGWVPLYWRWGPVIGVGCTLAIGKHGFSGALQWINTWPAAVLVGLGVLWPLLTWILWRQWLERTPTTRRVGSMPSASLWGRFKKYVHRYVPLSFSTLYTFGPPGRTHRTAWHVILVPAGVLVNPNVFATKWGDGVSWVHLWILGFFALFSATVLVCKDLHWRMLLAPAGLHRGRLAWHIALSTATLWALALLSIATGAIGVAWGFLDMPWTMVLRYLSNYYVLPVQLIFAISVATLVRGVLQSMWLVAVLTVWGAGGLVYLYVARPGLDTPFLPALFSLGWDSVGVLLALSAVTLWVANRVWTVDKLMQCAPK